MESKNRLITGVDIVNVGRIEKILSNRRDKFYNKIFTEKEIEHITNKGHKPTTVAGIFAAKEAISKALGTGIGVIGWKDIEVLHAETGKPYVNFTRKKIIDDFKIEEIQLSISHEVDYAVAFVVGYITIEM